MRQATQKARRFWLSAVVAILWTVALTAGVAQALQDRMPEERELLTTTATITARIGNRLKAGARFFAVARESLVTDAAGNGMSFTDIPLPSTAEISFFVQKDVGPVVLELHLR